MVNPENDRVRKNSRQLQWNDQNFLCLKDVHRATVASPVFSQGFVVEAVASTGQLLSVS